MRIEYRFVFEGEGKEVVLPLNYRKMVLSLIKEAFRRTDFNLYNFYFSKQSLHQKPYTFSIYLPKPEFLDENVIIKENRMDVVFSSPDYQDIITLYNGLIKDKYFSYRGKILKLINIFPRRERTITSSTIKCKTLSPFLIRVHNQKDNKDEYKLLNKNNIKECNYHLNVIMERVFKESFSRGYSLKIIPDKIKGLPVKIKDNGKSFGLVLANQGTFYLKGEPEVLKLAYQTGIGSRRSYGFGLFEVVENCDRNI